MTRRTRTAARLLAAGSLVTAGLVLPGLAPSVAADADAGTDGVAGFGAASASGEAGRLAGASGPTELMRMKQAGGNTVMLDTTWLVDNQSSNTVTPPSSMSDDDRTLALAANAAQQAGLNVMLTVKVECQCDKRWRGTLKPTDPDRFLVGPADAPGAEGSYLYMSNHYADLAKSIGVAAYFIGSEMATLQRYTDDWSTIALQARERYSGRIGYEVNWDTMHEVGFWDEVDIAGLSAYMPLTDALEPNVSDLLEAWRSSKTQRAWKGTDFYAQVARLHAETMTSSSPGGKPVLFGEMGYQSAPQAAQHPWVNDKTDSYDPQLQADAYQAALTMFDDQPWWLGAVWWEWVSVAGEGDMGYSPRDKLAEKLLQKWYSGQRPPSRGESLVGETRPSSQGAPIPKDTLNGPTSPSGRTSSSRPVAPLPAKVRAAAPARAIRRAVAPVTSPRSASPSAKALLPKVAAPLAPPLPVLLAKVQPGTVEAALARAAARREFRRTSYGAAALLALSLMGHVLWLAPAAVRRRRVPVTARLR